MMKMLILFIIFTFIPVAELFSQSCATDTRSVQTHGAIGRLVINSANSGGWAPGTAWILPC